MAKRGEEKTIKVSADVEDLKRAFEQVERSYADVAKASKDYAEALEASSKAVTDEEKQVAKEVEKTTKTILADTKRRAAAYKEQANALKTQADALKQKIAATDNDTAASAKNQKSTKASAAALAGLGMAAFAAVGKLADLVQKYAELDAANGRLANSFRNAGASADDMANAEALATEMARRGQASRLDSVNSMRLLADASGSATQAIDDYRLAVDIASQTGKTAAEASDILAKVRNGEVSQLVDLRGLNKDLAEDLGKIEDETVRAQIAMDLLTSSYEGAADANAGLIDKQAAFKNSLEDLQLAAGNVASAIGESGVGLAGSFAKLFGIIEEGDDPVNTLSGSFNNFGNAIRETIQPMQDLIEAGGLFGAVFSGRSFSQILSDADTARAKAAAGSKDNKKAVEEETQAMTQQAEAAQKVKKVLEEQEKKRLEESEKARKIAEEEREKQRRDAENKQARAKAAAAEESARRKQQQAEEAAEREARLAAERLEREEEKAGIEALASARSEADKIREESLLRQKQMMEERHILMMMDRELSEEERQQLEIQLQLERELFDIRTSGMSDEAQIRAQRIASLKAETKALDVIANKTEDTAAKEAAANDASLEAAGGAIAYAAEAAGVKNAAIALEAGKKAAFYTAESVASFAGGNVPSGIGYGLAAAQHAVIAGGALISGIGGGGGGGGASAAPEERLQRSAPIITQAGARESGTTVNVNTLSYISPEDARRIGHAETREARATIGGRPR